MVYKVLESLESDKSTLAICTVVCREWFSFSRGLLFRRIHVNTTPQARGFESFAEFLRSSPTIATHIKTLTLRGHSPLIHIPTKGNSEREWGKKYCQWLNPMILTNILDKLPNLHSLTLCQLVWDHHPRTSLNPFDSGSPTHLPNWPPAPRSLKTLQLVSFRDWNPDFAGHGRNDFLCYFANLDELYVHIASRTPHTVQQMYVSPALSVRSLVIARETPGGIYDSLPTQPFQDRLHSLGLPAQHLFGQTGLVIWLKDLAVGITHFRLEINLFDYLGKPRLLHSPTHS